MASTARPVRGILKKRVKLNDSDSGDARAESGSGAHALRWDEPTLAAHDLDRGTRMKIEEPKTPFEREARSGSASEDERPSPRATRDSEQHHTLTTRLEVLHERQARGERIRQEGGKTRVITAFSTDDDDNSHSAAANNNNNNSTAQAVEIHDSSDDEADVGEEARLKRREFEQKRKMHYNEFSRVKRLRERNARALRGELDSSDASEESDGDEEEENAPTDEASVGSD